MRPKLLPTSRLGRATWWLRSPVTLVVLAVLLLVCAWGVEQRFVKVWAPGRARLRTVPRPTHEWDATTYSVWVYRSSPGQFEIIDPNIDSMDRLAGLFTNEAYNLIRASSTLRVERRGWLYPVHYSIERRVDFTPLEMGRRRWEGGKMLVDQAFTPEELIAARRLFDRWVAEMEKDSKAAAELAASGVRPDRWGRVRYERLEWRNVALNGAMGTLVVLMLASLGGMPRYLRVVVARHRLARGRCGVCRYELADVPVVEEPPGVRVVRCPECGRVWGAEAGGTPPGGTPPGGTIRLRVVPESSHPVG